MSEAVTVDGGRRRARHADAATVPPAVAVDAADAAAAAAMPRRRRHRRRHRPTDVDAFRSAQQSDADAAQLGDLFEYKLKEPVTIRKNQSALVPILSGEVEAEKVSLWNATSGIDPAAARRVADERDGPHARRRQLLGHRRPGVRRRRPDRSAQGRREAAAVVRDRSRRAGRCEGRERADEGHEACRSRAASSFRQTEERQRRTYIARNEDTEPRVLVDRASRARRAGRSAAR